MGVNLYALTSSCSGADGHLNCINIFLICLQNTLVIDTPRVRKQTRHYSSVKEDEMLEFSELESDEDEPSKPSSKPRRPQEKAQGYPRSECFRVEKNLLVYGSVACC